MDRATYQFVATPLHSSPPSVAAQLAIAAVEEAWLGEEEDHLVGHDANSYQPEGTGDASPWLSSRQIVNSAQDCGLAPKMYRQKKYKYSNPSRKGVDLKTTGTSQSIRTMRIPSEALDRWRE
jgi:hypothetical protein